MPLNETQIKDARLTDKAYTLADGFGVFLYVTPQGGKLWRLKYRLEGKEKLLALGAYPPRSTFAAKRAEMAA